LVIVEFIVEGEHEVIGLVRDLAVVFVEDVKFFFREELVITRVELFESRSGQNRTVDFFH
jgi:hypothetical protein